MRDLCACLQGFCVRFTERETKLCPKKGNTGATCALFHCKVIINKFQAVRKLDGCVTEQFHALVLGFEAFRGDISIVGCDVCVKICSK